MAGVIQWNEAMDQCGNDEEFLRELLVDLRTEADTQLAAIGAIIQVRKKERESLNHSCDCVLFLSKLFLNFSALFVFEPVLVVFVVCPDILTHSFSIDSLIRSLSLTLCLLHKNFLFLFFLYFDSIHIIYYIYIYIY